LAGGPSSFKTLRAALTFLQSTARLSIESVGWARGPAKADVAIESTKYVEKCMIGGLVSDDCPLSVEQSLVA
jgi:hypothetical protein